MTEVAIIGAGIAGLTAAHRLSERGIDCAVIEASERAGGRIYGFNVGDRAVQLGGRWLGPGQDRIKALAKEFGVDVRENSIFSDLGGDRVEGQASALVELARQLDNLAQTVPLDRPWDAANARELDSQTLATWLHGHADPETADLADSILSGFLPKASDVSLLHAAFYLHSNGCLLYTSDAADE